MQTECWKRGKITLTAVREAANPFLDVDITAVFTGPNGEKILLPGYWDGGQTFCVRFAPTAVGQWKYEIHANPDDPGLTQSGEIVCVPYTGELPLYRHSFVRTGPLGRYLTYADGSERMISHDIRPAGGVWQLPAKPGAGTGYAGPSVPDHRGAPLMPANL